MYHSIVNGIYLLLYLSGLLQWPSLTAQSGEDFFRTFALRHSQFSSEITDRLTSQQTTIATLQEDYNDDFYLNFRADFQCMQDDFKRNICMTHPMATFM